MFIKQLHQCKCFSSQILSSKFRKHIENVIFFKVKRTWTFSFHYAIFSCPVPYLEVNFPFLHALNSHLLLAYCVAVTIPYAGSTERNKSSKWLQLRSLHSTGEDSKMHNVLKAWSAAVMFTFICHLDTVQNHLESISERDCLCQVGLWACLWRII